MPIEETYLRQCQTYILCFLSANLCERCLRRCYIRLYTELLTFIWTKFWWMLKAPIKFGHSSGTLARLNSNLKKPEIDFIIIFYLLNFQWHTVFCLRSIFSQQLTQTDCFRSLHAPIALELTGYLPGITQEL